jgi:CubicO group peptidase (beta-lactamase class C family)
MKTFCLLLSALLLFACGSHQGNSDTFPQVEAIDQAMLAFVDSGYIPGAVTAVVTKEKILHLGAVGVADYETGSPMEPEQLFWIASMTKPLTAVALLMLQDKGSLSVDDPVSKYIPEFGALKTPSGKAANLTISQIMSHTSGLREADAQTARKAKELADLIPSYLNGPTQFEPGSRWSYCQSGINTGARIVEVVSGLRFDQFLQQRIFEPLGMKHTTFYPLQLKEARRAAGYIRNNENGQYERTEVSEIFGKPESVPLGNGGLFSTAPDYARFTQLLLGEGIYNGKRYLSDEAYSRLTTVVTGDLDCGFLQEAQYGSRGANYGWGIGTCILRAPHPGVAAMLSPGSFGHGGAWGTQAWIDPVKGVAYILMIQRPGFNSDASNIRAEFQQVAFDELVKGRTD